MGVSNIVKISDCTSGAPDGGSILCSLDEAAEGLPDDCPTLPVKLKTLPYGCGSPSHNFTPSYGNSDIKMVMGSTSLIEFVHDGLEENKVQLEQNFKMQPRYDDGQAMDDVPDCEWDKFGFPNGEDLVTFSSTVEPDAPATHAEKFLDQDSKISYISSSLIVNAEGASKDPVNCGGEIAERIQIDHIPRIFLSCHDKLVMSEPYEKMDDLGGGNITLGSKVDAHQLRGKRRRLVYDMTGTYRSSFCDDLSNNSSSSYPSHGSFATDDRQFCLLNSRPIPSSRVLPSIGLHLNSLASTSNDILVQGSFASTRSLVPMSSSISSLAYINTGQASERASFPNEKDLGSSGRGVHDPLLEDGSQAVIVAKVEDSSHDSPKKKKRKTENGGDGDGNSCRRCNCKKSKCLKLYCECFAAGLYCVEPCTCQGCMNKPMHEDTVVATRKQIESRNPLAFAPKVIRASEPTVESGEEAIIKTTPASARHKRGCNCKKSGCLKKYCECYQSGVGCSIGCRCEDCKNTFGRKIRVAPISQAEETEHDDGHSVPL